MASIKATEAALGIEPTEQTGLLRRILKHAENVDSHVLHVYFLAAPDFVLGPDADPSIRNVIGIAQAAPDLAKKVVNYRQRGAMVLEKWLGKVIHPVAAVAGGFTRPLLDCF